MTISSVNPASYTTLLNKVSNEVNGGKSNGKDGTAKLGDDQLLALAKSLVEQGATASSSSDPVYQDLVSLGNAALGKTESDNALYNAKGLLLKVQSSMQLYGPESQADSSSLSALGQSNALNDSVFSALNANAGTDSSSSSLADLYSSYSGTSGKLSILG
ncbi:hypothetical protein [Uliginosibacterium gangwonense]|uniref:hypothetical protein n=1 Tax=Uliginosibacterium gangwonense TaxID=392736 RepID=UPI00035D999C|nr:hypothetical protein [Uliginosibacterium gangwonense]